MIPFCFVLFQYTSSDNRGTDDEVLVQLYIRKLVEKWSEIRDGLVLYVPFISHVKNAQTGYDSDGFDTREEKIISHRIMKKTNYYTRKQA